MYRELLKRRNRFWTRWMLFSVVHLLVSAIIIYCYEIRRGDFADWLSKDMNDFVKDVAIDLFFILNLPFAVARENGLILGRPAGFFLACAMTVLDSILYGAGLACVLWLAGREAERRPRYLGFTPRVLGRGLIIATGYLMATLVIGYVMLAETYGLVPLSEHVFWQEELAPMFRVMHPLATFLGLGFQNNDIVALDFIVVMMLDSAMIGVLVAWGWYWLLPTQRSNTTDILPRP